ncbi:MAG TPA: O-antigen ligase family protein [Acidobacteriota bacterium]|jgi:hypothetical protein
MISWFPETRSRAILLTLAALIFSLPYERIVFSTGPFSFSDIELFCALFFVAFGFFGRFEKQLLFLKLSVAAFCFIVALFLSALIQTAYRDNALKFSLRMLAGIVLAWLVASLVRRESHWRLVLLTLFSGSGGLAAILGLIEWGIPRQLDRWYWIWGTQPHWIGGLKRLTGTFEYPNIAASFFLFALAASISLGLSGRKFHRAVAFLVLVALVLTYSRGALIAALASLVAVAALNRHSRSARREMIVWVAVLAALSVSVLWITPRLVHRVTSEGDSAWLKAGYQILSLPKSLAPDRTYFVPLRLTNEGTTAWEQTLPFRLSYHWYDGATLQMVVRDGLRTPLPVTVSPGQSTIVNVAVKTPGRPGDFLLAFDMVLERFAWFSERGAAPALIRCQIGSAEAASIPFKPGVKISDIVDRGFTVTSRLDLWRAAWKLFERNKWVGVGPDNFRFQYEKALGRPTHFTTIFANNLFLEVLADAGLIGFGALAIFFYLLLRKLLDAGPGEQIALLAFLVHGLVDYFLEFSPIYISFWIFIGIVAAIPEKDAHRH